MCQIFRLFHSMKVLTKPSLKDWPVCSTYCILQLISVQATTKIRSDEVQSISLLLIIENRLPFTEGVMVVSVHKCVQQTHLLALHLETLGYIPCLLNACNG